MSSRRCCFSAPNWRTISLREVDLKTVLTVHYEDVEHVRKNYGRPGFGGRRVHPRTNRVAMIAILGVCRQNAVAY